MAERSRKLGVASFAPWAWLFIVALALVELFAHASIQAAVPSEDSWDQAAAFVRERHRSSDRIVAAPPWTDPIVRSQLGDLSSLRSAAAPDDAGFQRTWELSVRGATSRGGAPALERVFGDVRVRMWRVGGDSIVYDFVTAIDSARVELVDEGEPVDCPRRRARTVRGGLFYGPMPPVERFVCDPSRPWLWVGATVLADLELRPRRCVWQHPAGTAPVRTTFSDALLGDRIIVRAGVDYAVARRRSHAPVTLAVRIDGRPAGTMAHRDGDGWSGFEIDTSGYEGQRAEVSFETTAEDPSARLFCWSATATKRRASHGRSGRE